MVCTSALGSSADIIEMGILLWSEFEFGDALYPVDKEFLDNVQAEVEYQVRRVNHHPSLALWAGGNELENLELAQIRDSVPALFPKYQSEYETLFLDIIGVTVFENTRSISYTPSSTSNGWTELDFSKKQPIKQRYYNVSAGEIHGDTDYYNYDYSVAFQYDLYPRGRFSNEFGFHSMPSTQTWRQAVEPADLRLDSPVVMLRNHHPAPGGLNSSNLDVAQQGMDQMTGAAKQWYPTPNKQDPVANFTSWCLATQIFQADYYGSQIKYYRRGSGGPERQLGSLYWQLEDIWQAPTWAGIEYDGRWKVLHYVAKNMYKHVIISPFQIWEPSALQVYVTSDLWSGVSGEAKFQWFDWKGNKLDDVKFPSTIPVTVGAINSTKILDSNLTDVLSAHKYSDVLLRMSISANGTLPNSNDNKTHTFTHTSWFHPIQLVNAALVDPGLTIKYLADKHKFVVEATKGVAAWVWLDYPAGTLVHFEDNGFWLAKGEPREIGYSVDADMDTTRGKWIDGVTVSSLWDMTTP
jgi:beta-mannosidase